MTKKNNKRNQAPSPEPTQPLEAIVSLQEVAKRMNKTTRTIRRWYLEEGIMPKPIFMNNAVLGWRESVLSQWLLDAEQRNQVTY
tara:strand:- start:3938 stop:4189 length:252 start_codon:yes stop_codon:yes gene_type:complete